MSLTTSEYLLLLRKRRAISSTPPPAQAYSDKVLALSPIAYYTFANNANDSSGNGFNGTASNITFGVTNGIGDGNTAADFDGSTSYCDIGAIATAFNGDQGSFSVWAKTTNAAWADAVFRYIARFSVSSSEIFIDKTSADQLLFRRRVGTNTRSVVDTSVSDTEGFFHAGITWTTAGGGELKAYINGIQVGTTQTVLSAFAGTLTAAVVGALNTVPASVWIGSIAHLAIFSTVLSASDMANLAVV